MQKQIILFFFASLSLLLYLSQNIFSLDESTHTDFLDIFSENDEEKRINAIKKLVDSGGEGSYNCVKWLLLYDPSLSLKISLVSYLGDKKDTRYTEILSEVLAREDSPPRLKIGIIDSLEKQSSELSFNILYPYKDSEDTLIRERVREVLNKTYKEYTKKKGGLLPYKQKDLNGLWLYPLGLGIFGFLDMQYIADISNAEEDARGWIGISGLTLGVGTGYFLNNDGHISSEEALTTFSMGVWGGYTANRFIDLFSIEGSNDENWASLSGTVLGLTAGSMYSKGLKLTKGDIAFANLSGLGGNLIGSGINKLTLGDHPRGEYENSILMASASLGLLGGTYLIKRGFFTENDIERTIYSSALLSFTGGFIPNTLNLDNDRYNEGGALVGLGLGFFGGTISKKLYNEKPSSMRTSMLSFTYGSMFGAGIPSLLGNTSSQLNAITMLSGGWGFGALSALYSDEIAINNDGLYLASFSPIWGTFQVFCFSEFLRDRFNLSDDQVMGFALTTIPVFGIAGWFASQNSRIDFFDSSIVILSGFWGSWLAGWGGVILQHNNDSIDDSERWLITGIGGDVGFAIGSLLVSPIINIDRSKLGIINLSGAAGMALGIAIQAIVDPDSTSLAEGNLIGSIAGIAAGAIGSTLLKDNQKEEQRTINLSKKIKLNFPIPTIAINRDDLSNEEFYEVDLTWFF